ncbi:hypothetical protein L6452_08342 [Arctium lappa]|uniref:Uncharacterized protein n=1 Tax=Arctium lappa TaxID=4217 RepID=A0ACB9DHM9_ARCLA|nr:hypothetical protein L6452_08342 [Arctium lappa]
MNPEKQDEKTTIQFQKFLAPVKPGTRLVVAVIIRNRKPPRSQGMALYRIGLRTSSGNNLTLIILGAQMSRCGSRWQRLAAIGVAGGRRRQAAATGI